MPADLTKRINLDLLYPPFCVKYLDLLANCRAAGADYVVTSGYRSPDEQMALWRKGRNANGAVIAPGEVVTRVKFGAHNCGVAADAVRDTDVTKPGVQVSWKKADYVILATQAEQLNLEAGANWKTFQDAPHVQLPLNKRGVSLQHLAALYASGGIAAVWAYLDTKGPW